MRRFLSVFLLIPLSLFWSCDDCTSGQGPTTLVSLTNLDNFTGVSASGTFDVTIRPGNELQVDIFGQQNIIDRVVTSISNGVLSVGFRNGCIEDFQLRMEITMPTIDFVENAGTGDVVVNPFTGVANLEISSTGTGNITVNGPFSASNTVEISSSGTGNITMNFSTSQLTVEHGGTGRISLAGSVVSQAVELTATGDYDAFDLSSAICNINSSGTGNSEVSVTNTLNVTIAGTGNVSYRGNPVITQEITGTGQLINAN